MVKVIDTTAESPLDALLEARAKTHGDFAIHAAVTQEMERAFWYWAEVTGKTGAGLALTDTMREALHMIFHKLGRIAAGDPTFPDHWADIAGYAELVVKDLQKNA